MFSPQRILNAFKYTRQGLKSAWETEAAFRDDVILVLALQLACLYFKPSITMWLFLCFANALLLVIELLNTGIEYLADHTSLEKHDLLGRAKDVGSAAVFMFLVINTLVFALIVAQHFGWTY